MGYENSNAQQRSTLPATLATLAAPTKLNPAAYLIATLACWMQRGQQSVIDYLIEENRVLKAKHGKRRIRFTDAERVRLARAGNALGRKLLNQYATIATPHTIMRWHRWHRKLVALKWTFQRKRTGRPRIMAEIEKLIVKMARDNPTWGYERIQGALKNLMSTAVENRANLAVRRAATKLDLIPRKQILIEIWLWFPSPMLGDCVSVAA